MGRTPEDVNADDYNVLYIGHSFGRQFAESLEDYAHTAGVSNHATYIVFSGGASGAPDQLWADTADRKQIQAFLDTGEIDALIMICCSIEFVESEGKTDEAVWNFTDYAHQSRHPHWFVHALEGFPCRLRALMIIRTAPTKRTKDG